MSGTQTSTPPAIDPPGRTSFALARWTHRATGAVADRGAIPVWAGFIGAPLLWMSHLTLTYMLVPWVCTTQKHWVGHLVTLLFAAGGVWFCYLCWREWRHVGGGEPGSGEDPPVGRTRFAAVIGLLSSALFTLIIIAEHIPAFILNPCWD